MKKIAIIGAGPMGLTCAYRLLQNGCSVDVYEKNEVIGGMSTHFDFSGLDIEKYYHFVCGTDYDLFDLMKELEIIHKLEWTETKMGYYYQGKLYKWGGPFELLLFPKASIMEKIRYGIHVFLASKRKNWKKLDDITALEWIKKWEGEKGYKKFWDSLFHLKFYDLKETIAAPWIWSRIARVAKSRKNIFTERMGYIVGGSKVFTQALEREIIRMGGTISTNANVSKVSLSGDRVTGITVDDNHIEYDNVISTIPLQYINSIVPELPANDRDTLTKLDNVGIVCVIVKSKKTMSRNFWMNITDDNIATPGMIEFSNLNTTIEKNVIYAPFYLHKDSPMYSKSKDYFVKQVKDYIFKINPEITQEDIEDTRVFKYEYAQPVATTNFLSKLPLIESDSRKGFFIVDTAFCYPEDRSIQESVKIANTVVEKVVAND